MLDAALWCYCIYNTLSETVWQNSGDFLLRLPFSRQHLVSSRTSIGGMGLYRLVSKHDHLLLPSRFDQRRRSDYERAYKYRLQHFPMFQSFFIWVQSKCCRRSSSVCLLGKPKRLLCCRAMPFQREVPQKSSEQQEHVAIASYFPHGEPPTIFNNKKNPTLTTA